MKSRIRWATALLVGALQLAACVSAPAKAGEAAAKNGEHLATKLRGTTGGGIRVQKNVMVPMRDGVRLATDIYRPVGGDGKYPVVLIRTPYGSETPEFAKKGQYYVE